MLRLNRRFLACFALASLFCWPFPGSFSTSFLACVLLAEPPSQHPKTISAAQALPLLESATGAEDHYLAASAYLLLHRFIGVGTNGLKFTQGWIVAHISNGHMFRTSTCYFR